MKVLFLSFTILVVLASQSLAVRPVEESQDCRYILAQVLINPCECECGGGPIEGPTVAYVLQPIRVKNCPCDCNPADGPRPKDKNYGKLNHHRSSSKSHLD